MATNATSNVYSTGFADPNFLDSNQHSAKTDAYGLGISLLMALTGGEPSRGLRSTYEDDVLDMVAGKEGAGGGLLHAARRAAHWPQAATRELVKAVHGLVYERKSQRLPLPEALAAFEAALRFGDAKATPEPLALMAEGGTQGTRNANDAIGDRWSTGGISRSGDDDGGADAGVAAEAALVAAERPTAYGSGFSAATSSGASASGASAGASSSSGGGSLRPAL